MITGIMLELKENSVSVEKNVTNITITATISWNSDSYDYYGKPLTLQLNGEKVDYRTNVYFNRSKKTSGSEVFYSYSCNVEHDGEGKKVLSCTLIYHTNLLGGERTVTKEWELTPIQRESTVRATDANIGATSMIAIAANSAGFTHSVAYAFESLSGYIKADGSISTEEVLLSSQSVPFVIPESFYTQIPNAPTGVCTLTCRTYSGTTQIGNTKTCKFMVTAERAQCRPDVAGTVEDVNDATIALTGDPAVLVRYMSVARCTIQAKAKNGASIKSLQIGGVEAADAIREISGIESGPVVFKAVDTREYDNSHTVALESGTEEGCRLIPYVKLTAHATAKRKEPTSGEATLTIKGKYYAGTFGQEENSLTLWYKVPNAAEFTPVDPSDIEIADGAYTATVDLQDLAYNAEHTIQVVAEDQLITLEESAALGRGIPMFYWGEELFGFFVWLKMNGHQIRGLGDPELEDDAVNKRYVDTVLGNADFAAGTHDHNAGAVKTGTFHSDRLPTVPITKGGTGATTAPEARKNLGIEATKLYSGTLSSGTASFSGVYSFYIILGRTKSGNSRQSITIPAEMCDGSTKYQLYSDGTYINFTISTNGLTVGSAPTAGGAITEIYGVN